MKTITRPWWSNIIFYISAGGAFFYCAYLAIAYANQPLLEAHSFRQMQTALTTYWFIHEGFKFAYETPVAGVPWSIPFEFPIYQLLVATVSSLLKLPLDAVGRVSSFLFLALCLIPVRSITRALELPSLVFYIFVAMLFSAPVYIFWGRAFMIETASVFFLVVAIKYYIDTAGKKYTRRSVVLYLFFITLSILQKATTALPVLALLSISFIYLEIKRAESIGKILKSRTPRIFAVCFLTPLIVGASWVIYTDHVKSLNPLGMQLTSTALKEWNWGTLEQRFSSDLFERVVWERIFVSNLAGILGIALLLIPLFAKTDPRITRIVFISAAFGFFPLLLFSNLHIVHDYYQSANVVFLVYAISVVLGAILSPAMGSSVVIPILALILTSNYINFVSNYLPKIESVFNSNRDLIVGRILKEQTPLDAQFVAFGNDWSSSFAYISQRKSFTVPDWSSKLDLIKSNPENFVEKGRLGAVVSCSVKSPNLADLIFWSLDNRSWKIGETHGCFIVTPENSFGSTVPNLALCQGSIDRAQIEDRDGIKVIVFLGWSAISESKGEIAERVYVTMTRKGGETIYLEGLKVPRPDVNEYLGISKDVDAGFSRIALASFEPGEYEIGISQTKGGLHEVCQFKKKVMIN